MPQTIAGWLERNITLHTHDTREEEMWNGGTHAAGALLSIAGLVLLMTKVLPSGNSSAAIGALVFGLSMILSYTSSAVYHFVRPSNWKRFLRIMDHVNIYILIAGTYTPICVAMNSGKSLQLLRLVWLIAVLGIIFKLVFWGRLKAFHVGFYLAMGWLVVFYLDDLRHIVPREAALWIIGGGLSYTLGVLFYSLKKMPHYHAVWHLFVLGGSACFYLGIFHYIIPG